MPRCYLLKIDDDPWALLGVNRAEAAYTLREKLIDRMRCVADGEPVAVTVRTESVSQDELDTRQDW